MGIVRALVQTSTYVKKYKYREGNVAFRRRPNLNVPTVAAALFCGSAGLRHPYDTPCTRQATLLAEKHGLNVCIIDPNLEKRWIPNYGVWVEEWEALDKDLQVPRHGFPRVL